MYTYKSKLFTFIIFILLIFILSSCSKQEIKPIELPKSNFEKTEYFKLDDLEIIKPGKPNYILLNSEYELVDDPELSYYVAFKNIEFAKIVALSKSFDNLKEVNNQLVTIINLKVDEINSLKEIISYKEIISDQINLLYVNERQIRELERKEYKFQKIMDKIYIVIQSGVIVALAIAAI
jgi:hypothetical protein